MKILVLVFFSLFFLKAQAQGNLVVNPSFENMSSIPLQDGELYKAIGWKSPNVTFPNLYSMLSPQPYVSVPLGDLGYHYQFPRTGNNFAGFMVFRYDFIPDYRMYIQGKLSDALENKKKYTIEYFINLGNVSVYSVNNLGVYFSSDSFFVNSPISLLDTPQFINPQTNQLNDTLNWIKVSGTYIAKGGEKYITIGCFSSALGLDTFKLYNLPCIQCAEAYYNIDDVSVTLWDSTSSVNEMLASPQINVSPNPSQSNFTVNISFQKKDTEFELYDVFGTLQQKKKLLNSSTNFSTDFLPNGLYLYRVISSNNIIQQGKLVIAK